MKRPVGVLQNKLSPIKRSMGPTLNLEIRGHPDSSPEGSKSERVFGITQVILRTEPGEDQAQVGVLEKNQKADRLSQEPGQWDKIRLEDGTEGFVPNALLTTWLPADGQMDIVHIVGEQEPAPPSMDSEFFAILAPPRATVDQARAWAESKGATETFLGLAELYWSISPSVGVDPAVAYAQSAKETNFGKFTGVLDETYKNPCGMKRTETGKPEDSDDYIAEAHKRFDSWEDGISAHVDHLALYAGAAGYPKEGTLDPRHFESLFGRCPTVESLGGNWGSVGGLWRESAGLCGSDDGILTMEIMRKEFFNGQKYGDCPENAGNSRDQGDDGKPSCREDRDSPRGI